MELSEHFKTYSTDPNCRIIIDSCSDITLPLVQSIKTDLIEFPFIMQDGEHLDDQFQSITPDEFYGRMRAGERVSTSAISTGQFIEIFENCAQDGIPTLYLSFTAGLSSSIHDAQQAAAQVLENHPGFELEVIDNCNPSLGTTLLACEACRLRDEGASMQEVADWVEGNKHKIHSYFTLESLDWLVAGGRVPKAAGSLTAVLDMKANLTYDLDGALTLTGVSRGRKKALKNLIKELHEHYGGDPTRAMDICDAGCPEDADTLEQMVRDELGDECPEIYRLPLDPTVGAHVGPGMIALAFWGGDRANMENRGKR